MARVTPSVIEAEAQPAPARRPLPATVVRLDAQGRILAVIDDGMGLVRSGRLDGQTPFSHSLTTHHCALWERTQWPALCASGQLDEALLEFHGGDAEPVAVVSYWRHDKDAATPCVVGMLLPGSERQQLMLQLRGSQESLDAMPAAVLQIGTTETGQLVLPYAVGALRELAGVSCSMVCRAPETLLDALSPESRARLMQRLLHTPPTLQAFTEVIAPLHQPDRQLQLSASRPLDASIWHCVVTDVSDREQLQAELRRLATTDDLTRLANRRALLSALAERLAVTRQLAICYMDCDRFKQINDSLGHSVGDALLQQVAIRLRSQLCAADGIVSLGCDLEDPVAARLGGDEFVVLATGIDGAASAGALAQRLLDAAAQPYVIGGVELVITVSMGVAIPGADSTPEQLLRDADTAMYEAKRLGRGRWALFEPQMQHSAAGALSLELDLRQALAAGHVRAAFQPIVEIDSGRIRGFEALARWRHPVRGEVSPAHFIAVAEDSGQISVLGQAILEQACQALAGWRRAGLAGQLRMSVNLSRAQLLAEDLPRRIDEVLKRCGLPADALQLEVTETMAMEISGLGQALERLRTLGVRLSLDDVGTGHSSLAALHQLPVQQVKIDRSFVKELGESPYHRAVVQAALHVAAALRLDVVAEGVETVEQAASLEGLGCRLAQGWLYAKAVEADQAMALLDQCLLPADVQAAQSQPAAAPDYQVIITDAQGLTTHVNAAFTRSTGYSIEDMLGMTPGAVLQGPLSSAEVIASMRRSVQACEPAHGLEIVNYRKDGTPFLASIDIEPVILDGKLSAFMSVQSEMTEPSLARQRLAKLRQGKGGSA
jgi:diguanylate cyclase (GGDEF)-like protein/PAS domain S-box-containing protein